MLVSYTASAVSLLVILSLRNFEMSDSDRERPVNNLGNEAGERNFADPIFGQLRNQSMEDIFTKDDASFIED